MKKYILIIPIFLIALSTSIFVASAAMRVILSDVVVKKNGVPIELYWYLNENDGYYYLDYDGTGTIGNGLLGFFDYIESNNSRFNVLEFVNTVNDEKITFDLSQSYLEITVANISNDYFLLDFTYIRNMATNNYQVYVPGGTYIRIKDNEKTYSYEFASIIYELQSQHLLEIGLLESDINTLENEIIALNNLIDQTELTFYDLGYDEAINFAYQNGFDSFVSYIDENSYSYLQGRINGINEGSDLNIGIRGFVPSLLGAIGGFFLTLGAIEFMGLSLNGIITFLALLILILFVIKLIFGGGD